jgi:hypothetical protein
MAQPLLCDAHREPGVMLMNTLIPPVESMVFCAECLPAQVAMLFEQLGLMDAFAEVVRQQEREKIAAEAAKKPKGRRVVKRDDLTVEDSIAILAGEDQDTQVVD